MDRRLRATLLILLFLVGVVVVAQWVIKPIEEKQIVQAEDDWNEGFIFPDFIDKKVVRYQVIQQEDGWVAYEKRDGRWWLVKPVEERGNHKLIQVAAEAVLKIRWLRDDIEGGLKKPEYGLWPPQARIVAETEDGMETRPLLFGKEAAEPQQVYAAVEGSDKVYTVDRKYFISAVRFLNEVRVNEILDRMTGNPSRIQKLNLKFEDQSEMELVRRDGNWRITRPDPMGVDEVSMADRLKKWNEMVSPLEWVDDTGVRRDEFGLDKPIFSLDAVLAPEKEGDPEEKLGLKVARIEKDGVANYYLQTDWYKPIYRIQEKTYRLLALNSESLIEMRFFPLDPEKIQQVRIESQGKSEIAALRQGEGWVLLPDRAEGSSYAIEKFLHEITEVRALQTEPMNPDKLQEKQLDSIKHKITVTMDDPTEWVVAFGEDVAQGYTWCLYSRDSSRFYLVNQRTIDGWPQSIDDFKPIPKP